MRFKVFKNIISGYIGNELRLRNNAKDTIFIFRNY